LNILLYFPLPTLICWLLLFDSQQILLRSVLPSPSLSSTTLYFHLFLINSLPRSSPEKTDKTGSIFIKPIRLFISCFSINHDIHEYIVNFIKIYLTFYHLRFFHFLSELVIFSYFINKDLAVLLRIFFSLNKISISFSVLQQMQAVQLIKLFH